MSISANKYVTCTYELYAGTDDERELVEAATMERPLEYVHGMGMMLPEFEKQLFGLHSGDKFDFVLTAEQGYGELSDENILELSREIFLNEEGQFDTEMVFEGNVLPMYTPEGHTVQGTVLEVKADTVLMDFNHPLAGKSLHFIGQVVDEHEATAEELQHFIGGHGGGCGCSSGDDQDGQGGCSGCSGGCC